ncbi:O-methyltransferase [Cryptosporangium japonicum]|uniref:O-methyltransferase n=1 Tax=Cryptosporangium japonicum TaxID=80872 RepID=A0ABP3EJQ4_9ACTN
MYESDAQWREVDYFADTLVPEDEALAAARLSGHLTTMPSAEVAPNQGRLLALLAQMAGAKRVLEFGTLAGYSTIWLARAVGEQGHVTTLEVAEPNAAVARVNLERAGVLERVDVVVGPAAASAQRLVDDGAEPFAFVFIDADKPNNPAYLATSLALSAASVACWATSLRIRGWRRPPSRPWARRAGTASRSSVVALDARTHCHRWPTAQGRRGSEPHSPHALVSASAA